MTYLVAGVAFVTFFGTQILLEKDKSPKFLMRQNLLSIILIAILFIGLSIVLSVLTKITLIAIVTTIYFASLISWKYRQKFNHIESGKEHV